MDRLERPQGGVDSALRKHEMCGPVAVPAFRARTRRTLCGAHGAPADDGAHSAFAFHPWVAAQRSW